MSDQADVTPSAEVPSDAKSKKKTAVQFLLRGLAISLPPVLTLVILLWVARGINDYIIQPVSTAVRFAIAVVVEESRPTGDFVRLEQPPPLEYCDARYRVTPELKDSLPALVSQIKSAREANAGEKPDGAAAAPPALPSDSRLPALLDNLDQVYVPLGESAVPYSVYAEVAMNVGPRQMPATATGVYMELVTTRYFRRLFNLSAVAVALVIVMLYFIGRFVTARIGSWIVGRLETRVMARLPFVSNVYASVKQVTDFVFTERTITYNRIVAVEYPRKGVWAIAYVTGDGLLEMTAAAGEPMLTLLIPTSPMPMTGFTVCVPRRDTIDINVTFDQAFQFCLSCGVLTPPQQKITPELLQKELTKRLIGGINQAAPGAGKSPDSGAPPADGHAPTQWDVMRGSNAPNPPSANSDARRE